MNRPTKNLRARAELVASGYDFALLSSLANITYVSNFEAPVPLGAGAEFSYAQPLLLCRARDNAKMGRVTATGPALLSKFEWDVV